MDSIENHPKYKEICKKLTIDKAQQWYVLPKINPFTGKPINPNAKNGIYKVLAHVAKEKYDLIPRERGHTSSQELLINTPKKHNTNDFYKFYYLAKNCEKSEKVLFGQVKQYIDQVNALSEKNSILEKENEKLRFLIQNLDK